MKRILIACEESQVVTTEFRKLGFEAFSCDTEPCSGGHPVWHIQGDARAEAYSGKYGMMIAHPPCTYLTVTGNKWMKPEFADRFPNRIKQRKDAVAFFLALYDAPIARIAIENPVGIMSTRFRKPDQYVHPFFFGDKHSKKTGLWLKGLPVLVKTEVVEPEMYVYKDGRKDPMWHVETMKLPSKERTKARSKTYQGFAQAMAEQWSKYL